MDLLIWTILLLMPLASILFIDLMLNFAAVVFYFKVKKRIDEVYWKNSLLLQNVIVFHLFDYKGKEITIYLDGHYNTIMYDHKISIINMMGISKIIHPKLLSLLLKRIPQ